MLSRGQISGLDGRAAQASFASSSFGKTRSRVDSRASFSPAPVASRGRSPKGSRRRCMAASTCARGNLRTIAREQAAARVCRVRLNKGLRLRVWRSAVIAQTTSKHRVRPGPRGADETACWEWCVTLTYLLHNCTRSFRRSSLCVGGTGWSGVTLY